MFCVFRTSASFALLFGLAVGAAAPAAARPIALRVQPAAQTLFHVFFHSVRALRRFPLTAFAAGPAVRGNVTTIPAVLEAPIASAYDADNGKLYVLDQQQSSTQTTILQVGPSGETLRFATLPIASANGIAYDHATRSFYVSSDQSPSSSNPSLLSVSSSGAVSLLAGGSSSGSADGTGSAASFRSPSGIAVDTVDGALYVADSDRVRRVTVKGVVTTLTQAGVFGGGYGGTPRVGMTYDPIDGNVYAADPGLDTVDRISTGSGTVVAVAGQCYSRGLPQNGGFCDPLQRDGRGPSAFFAAPVDIVANPLSGALYVADHGNNSVRRIDLQGNVTTLAGNGLTGTVDGAGQNAEFDMPIAISYNSRGGGLDVLDFDSGVSVALRSVTTTGTTPPPANTPITLFNTSSPDAFPFAIDWRPTSPPSSTLIYSENTGRIAQITTSGVSSEQSDPNANTFPPSGPFDAVYGADSSSWYLNAQDQQLDHRSVSGAISVVPLASGVSGFPSVDQLTLGPGGYVWFAIPSFSGTAVGFVTPAGNVTTYVLSEFNGRSSLAFQADAKLWVTTGNTLVELGRSGRVFYTDTYPSNYVTQGPDGNVWFTQNDAVGTIKPNNTLVVYPIVAPIRGCPRGQTCSRNIGAITTGSDGALWFTEQGAIGRLATDGTFSEFPVLAARTAPVDIVGGPDGNLWFVDGGAQKIGRLNIH